MAGPKTDQQLLVDLVREAKDKPQYEQLMEYLSLRRSVPPQHMGYLGGDQGLYERNGPLSNELPRTGVITIDRAQGDANTLVHELTHAAVAQLTNQYSESPRSALDFRKKANPTQFTDAFDKIMLGERGKAMAPVETAHKMDPAWTAANSDYRATAGELMGFAMGNSWPVSGMVRNPDSKVPQHLDATLATQMMILLDLATRAEKKKPQSQGR